MKKIDSIPTKKVERVAKLVSTGVKVGGELPQVLWWKGGESEYNQR